MRSTERRCKRSKVNRELFKICISNVAVFHASHCIFSTGHLNNKGIPIEASFSPDSQFIFSGSTDGRVHVWNADTGFKVCALNGDHPGPVQCVQFNPKYMMLASACTNMAFWLPTVEEFQ